jgi:hypothetical protein
MRWVRPAFPPVGLGPPVPIVVDVTQVHKRYHCFYRQFPRRTVRLGPPSCRFCYDKIVWTRAASRLAARHGREFVRHVVPAVAKPARTLWNDFIAFLFLCLAVPFAFKTVSFARIYAKAAPADVPGDLFRLSIAAFCTVVMLWYGVTSFLKARKISRS